VIRGVYFYENFNFYCAEYTVARYTLRDIL
jgi:hypothetical protein